MLKDLRCGGQDICQARGLDDLFGGKLSCVGTKGDKITSSSCNAGDKSTDYLKCGDNCYVSCEAGLSGSSVTTETFKGYQNSRGRSLSKAGCRYLCELAEGCISFKYTLNWSPKKEECTLKYNQQQAESSEKCKGNNLTLKYL